MKIVHLCLSCFYIDGSTYQENLLSKYHKALGYDVGIVASTVNQKNGKFVITNKFARYINEHGIPVIRLMYKGSPKIDKKLCRFRGLYKALQEMKPDVLFIHGCQSLDVRVVVRYLKNHPDVNTYVDNHADFMNSAKSLVSRIVLHQWLWKSMASQLEPYVTKFYGVLPARVDFLQNVYKIPREKTELLVLGVDDEMLASVKERNAGTVTRENYKLESDDILLVTGGKIDSNRPETLSLMEAVAQINKSNVKLLVFGSVIDDYRKRFNALCQSSNIIYAGWVNAEKIYEYFEAADLIAFPGLHSVLWEQAVGMGKACVFRRIEGFEHIDIGGNCKFFDGLSMEEMRETITTIIEKDEISSMQKMAEEKGESFFSYREIAKRCIGK